MYKLAGPIRRIISTLIDTTVLIIFIIPALIPVVNLYAIGGNIDEDADEIIRLIQNVAAFIIVLLGITVIAIIIYYVLIPQITKGRTLGRVITKTKVVNESYENPGIKALIIRDVFINHFIVPLLSIFIIIFFAITFFVTGKRSRTLGDVVSRTKLVRTDI